MLLAKQKYMFSIIVFVIDVLLNTFSPVELIFKFVNLCVCLC